MTHPLDLGRTPATVSIVGVGPGDPDLLTIRALRTIRRCDLLLHPGPRDDAGFAYEVVAPLLRPGQKVVGIGLTMRRGRVDDSTDYEDAARTLADASRRGEEAAFLTEGDPMLFSSGSYVADRLREGAPDIPVEVIPGVNALGAAAARLGWPLARKEQVLTICPATYHAGEIGAILDRGGPVCWLKAADVLPQLVEELRRRGRLDRAALIEKVGRPEERIFRDISQALVEKLSYFSLVLVR